MRPNSNIVKTRTGILVMETLYRMHREMRKYQSVEYSAVVDFPTGLSLY